MQDNNKNWSIRTMMRRDCEAAAALEAQTFSMPWSAGAFADALAQSDNIFLAAVSNADEIVGYCGLYSAADEGEITNVAVHEQWRGQGIGMALVRALLSQAEAAGISTVFLEVRKSNEGAQKLYEKTGFSFCGIRKNFYQRPREDGCVMRADLSGCS